MLACRPATELGGRVAVPASKYHAHRAMILASLAEGASTISGVTGALHVRMTRGALRRLGTRIVRLPGGDRIFGGPYRPTHERIPVGSSGSTLQFLLGLACRSVGPAVVFEGEKHLRQRPIGPLLAGLTAMGVRLEATEQALPVTVHPGRPSGGEVSIAGTLSQWISGLLMLAPLCSEETKIAVAPPVNERPYLDLTLRMMRMFGIEVEAAEGYEHLRVRAGQRYLPASVSLPPDMSSAAFGLAAAACLPGSVLFENVDARPDHPEADILRVLREMGAAMAFDADQRELRVGNHGVRLQGIYFDCADTPDLLPIVTVLAAVARGRSVLDHVSHARLKESDRVSAMLQLRRMGAHIDDEGDRLVIHGVPRLQPAVLSSYNDHRVLMALTVAGCLAEGGTSEINYPRAYRISYPEFLEHAAAMGLPARVAEGEPGQASGPWSTTRGVGTAAVVRSALPEAWRRAFAERGLWPERLITDYLADATAWTPQRPAVVDTSRGGRVLTYRELSRAVDRVATGLIRLGVRPGEPVAFQLPNWWEFAVLQLALARIGAVSCPLMPIFRQRELSFILRQAGCRVVVVPSRFRGTDHPALVAAIADQLPRLEHVLVVDAEGAETGGDGTFGQLLATPADTAALEARRPAPQDITQLLYTSGTSGEPKGVLHTHNSLLAALVAHVRHFALTDRDNVWVPSPCAHQTGFLYGLWLSVFLGSSGIYQDVWDARAGLEAIDRWQGRFVQAATPFLTDLAAACRERGAPPASLRLFVAAGAPIPRQLAQSARRELGVEIVGGWGTTESGLVAAGAPGDPPDRLWQTDGRVIAPMGMQVVDPEGLPLPAGGEGRFLVWTPAMFVGYLGHEDWYRGAFPESGWFDSGDLARIDPDGYVRITGRIKDVINRGGEKVPVSEVEELLYGHPAVAEAAVVAMPDPRLGERACAFVVLRPGRDLDLGGVQRHLQAAGMAKPYWPERLECVASLPRTPSGKIQKFRLRQVIAARIGAESGAAAAGQ